MSGKCLSAAEALVEVSGKLGWVCPDFQPQYYGLLAQSEDPPADELLALGFFACLIICVCLPQFPHRLMVLTLIMIMIMATKELIGGLA